MGDDARLPLVLVLLCVGSFACNLHIRSTAIAQTIVDCLPVFWVVVRAGKAPLQKQVKSQSFHGKRLHGFVFSEPFHLTLRLSRLVGV